MSATPNFPRSSRPVCVHLAFTVPSAHQILIMWKFSSGDEPAGLARDQQTSVTKRKIADRNMGLKLD
jgi:hypothetical protein